MEGESLGSLLPAIPTKSGHEQGKSLEDAQREQAVEVARISQAYYDHVEGLDEAKRDKVRANWYSVFREPMPHGNLAAPEPVSAAYAHPSKQMLKRAHEVVEALECGQEHGYWLFGGTGAGKTGIAELVLHAWREKGMGGLRVKESQMRADLQATQAKPRPGEEPPDELRVVVRRYAQTGLLILDDLGSTVKVSGWYVGQLFSVVDERWESQRPLIVTSNFTPESLERYFAAGDPTRAAALVSRLKGMCRVIDMGTEDHRIEKRIA